MTKNIYSHEKKYFFSRREIQNMESYLFRSSIRKVVPLPISEFFNIYLSMMILLYYTFSETQT